MNESMLLNCDGCGQPASPEHVAKRLKRLEWATRFRPLHISVLFLGAVSPAEDAGYLYSGAGEAEDRSQKQACLGEAARILEACGIDPGNGSGAQLAELQHRGFFLTYILECPAAQMTLGHDALVRVILRQFPSALMRVRRSLRPKRIAAISEALDPLLSSLASSDTGAELLLDAGRPFGLDGADAVGAARRLHVALATAAVAR